MGVFVPEIKKKLTPPHHENQEPWQNVKTLAMEAGRGSCLLFLSWGLKLHCLVGGGGVERKEKEEGKERILSWVGGSRERV